MTEHYINQKMAKFSVEKVTEFSEAKMADMIIKWLSKIDEIHYSKMDVFALPEWLGTL
jgi:hypothetical protein